MRALAQTSSALDSRWQRCCPTKQKVDGDDVVKVALKDLAVGDVVAVRPGRRRVPVMGNRGRSAAMDESMVTGESPTVRRAPVTR